MREKRADWIRGVRSFCTHEKVLAALEQMVQLYETVIPIASEISAFTDTRFGTSDDLMERWRI